MIPYSSQRAVLFYKVQVYICHVPGFREKFVTDPGTYFFLSTVFKKIVLVSCYVFFITLLFVIFSNCYRINFFIIVFLFGRKIFFSAITSIISLLLEMVSCYFKNLIWSVILFIFLIIIILTLSAFLFLFIILQQILIIVRVLFFLLVVILFMIDKGRRTYVHAIIQKTFVQDIGRLHCDFFCGLLMIASVWNFDGRGMFLQVKNRCKEISYVKSLFISWIDIWKRNL